jgi:hypothetical protein
LAAGKKQPASRLPAGAPFLFYTEPDKLQFFENGFETMLEQATANSQTGVVMASRSVAGFASFPPFQQMTETTINACCAEVMGQPADYTYGPFLLNRKLIPYLMQVQEDTGLGLAALCFWPGPPPGLHRGGIYRRFLLPARPAGRPSQRAALPHAPA